MSARKVQLTELAKVLPGKGAVDRLEAQRRRDRR